ncbi:MAG: restriction endonuclease subunit S [Tabrizicola sp.]
MRKLPAGWELAALSDLVPREKPIVYGIVQAGPEFPGGIPYIKSSNVGAKIDPASLSRTSPAIAYKYRRSVVRPGDIVFSLRGNIGQLSIVPDTLPEANLTQGTARISTNGRALNAFVAEALKSPNLQKRIDIVSKGSTFREISLEELRDLELPLPPLPEQRKIAEILRTWDEALEKLTALRAAKARRLDGLAAKLIHDEQAERLHLRDFLREVSTRNRGQQVERVLSVTNSAGFVLAEDQFAHRVASADLSNYKVVRRGHYAYNPSRINVGSIARLDAWEDGALSPMYVVFQVRDGLDSDFFGHWLRSAEARQRIALAAQGSVRETVSFGDLGSILIPVPTIDRQQAISRVLNAGRDEIALIDAEIEALTRQKRGLMQKLLTGGWRVKVEAPVA